MVRAHEQIKINKIKKTEMLQKARAALPLTKLRERAFEGAFFSVALIAMAGWVYFITLMLVRLFSGFSVDARARSVRMQGAAQKIPGMTRKSAAVIMISTQLEDETAGVTGTNCE